MAPGPNDKRVEMPERPADVRVRDFEEVPLGYTPEQAIAEAKRCLQCKKPLCIDGCPVRINIPEFIRLIADGAFREAALKLKEENALPAVCGRVCPQEEQCEVVCVLGRKGDASAIGALERFAADHLRELGEAGFPEIPARSGFRIAAVGAGPAGLTIAGELAKMGHEVVIFEALHEPGGVLMYGIPEFRLPKEIVRAEVNDLGSIGVELRTDMPVGKSATIEELLEEFDAVFVGTGAGLPRFLGVPGENLAGVLSANEYLTRVNLMRAWDPESPTPVLTGKKTVVFGGGNVALDSARCALRVGRGEVTIAYRRSRAEMPAREQEIHHAEEEGIAFEFLSAPTRILGDEKGRVAGVECLRMELGEPDDSGRRRPVPIEGSEYTIPADLAIVAIGNNPNPLISRTTPGLETESWGGIIIDPATGATSVEGVYAGGDIVTGAATVIEAMGAAKIAAAAIDDFLRKARRPKGEVSRAKP
ncbi:MAG: NADPH-dependent glutamate synthase [Planctomycetota bacterium]|jgi:glutamate synthase (NADPH/NADH) small chain